MKPRRKHRLNYRHVWIGAWHHEWKEQYLLLARDGSLWLWVGGWRKRWWRLSRCEDLEGAGSLAEALGMVRTQPCA